MRGKAAAEFVSVTRQKNYLMMLEGNDKEGAMTYEMIGQVMK